MSDNSPTLWKGITFTPEQEAAISFAPNGHLLVKGEAGSGKTLVLACRAKWINHRLGEGRLLFLTYNSALKAYVEKILADNGANHNVSVESYHEWARRFAAQLGYRLEGWLTDAESNNLLEEVRLAGLQKLGPQRLLELTVDEFWRDEMAWMLGRKFDDFEAYAGATRTGRASTRVDADGRQIVWKYFDAYLDRMESRRRFDFEAAAHLVFHAVNQQGGTYSPSQQYEHVFVDEVQDFHESWLMPLSCVARTSLTLAGDLAQRIYRRNFAWRSAGISVTGRRSRKLTQNFRGTRQIMQVAVHLATNPDLKDNEDYVSPQIPDRNGPPVIRIRRNKWWDAEEAALDQAHTLSASGRVVVACPMGANCVRVKDKLSARTGTTVHFAKRGDLVSEIAPLVVTTFHQLKGLEFDHLVLLALEDNTMPSFYLKHKPPEDHEQETQQLRRLVYVAMTRARETLVLAGGQPFSRFFDQVPAHLFDER